MLTVEETTKFFVSARFSLISYIFSITRDYHAAEDIYQEVCVRAVGRSDTFESTVHLMNWLRRVARNRAIDVVRSRDGKYVGLGEEVLGSLADEWDHEPNDWRQDRADALARCIQSLTPRSRQILRMQYFENRSSREIADFMKGKIESAYQAVARIHKSLRVCMQQHLSRG
ncbi:MAG: sigma-70 family RNA polymerase sigma factor [Planctomycetota bacterium]